jgi:uncharacterized protein DUF4383
MMVERTGTGLRHPVQTAAAVVGAVFLLVGVLGFIPGITSSYDQMGFAGHESGAMGLHLLLAIGMIGLGVLLGRRTTYGR